MNGKFFLYKYQEGQVVTLKKTHPCGGKTWKLLRVGAEVLMCCETCGHKMTLKRAALEKATVSVTDAPVAE
ncbi:MAG: DUF951 domain-containing protein [Clostridiales bacterium]|nr:DUF951 domain-containing protein [Clostridiales bacterium]